MVRRDLTSGQSGDAKASTERCVYVTYNPLIITSSLQSFDIFFVDLWLKRIDDFYSNRYHISKRLHSTIHEINNSLRSQTKAEKAYKGTHLSVEHIISPLG